MDSFFNRTDVPKLVCVMIFAATKAAFVLNETFSFL